MTHTSSHRDCHAMSLFSKTDKFMGGAVKAPSCWEWQRVVSAMKFQGQTPTKFIKKNLSIYVI